MECLEKEMVRCKRYNRKFSLILIDITNLQNYNDINGHANGDSALKQIAKIIQNHSRKGDLISYFGGDKFVLLLPEADVSSAFAGAERLRKRIAEKPFIGIENLPEEKLSITYGTAVYPADGNNVENLIKSVAKKMVSSCKVEVL